VVTTQYLALSFYNFLSPIRDGIFYSYGTALSLRLLHPYHRKSYISSFPSVSTRIQLSHAKWLVSI